jgi:hypothetical protein
LIKAKTIYFIKMSLLRRRHEAQRSSLFLKSRFLLSALYCITPTEPAVSNHEKREQMSILRAEMSSSSKKRPAE